MVKRLVCVVLVALAVAADAAAKEGARAHLLRPVPMHAAPGTLITVHWSVDVPGPNGTREGISAIGMFVRLVGRGGASTAAQSRENVGPPYSARVRVPRGGILLIRFGIAGAPPFYFPVK
jgi:hypothetical protein